MASVLEVLEAKLSVLIGPILKPLTAAFNLAEDFYERTKNIISDMQHLIDTATAELHGIQTFKLGSLKGSNKSRVVSIPRLQENIVNLVQIPDRIFIALKDLVTRIKSKYPQASEEAAAVAEEAEASDVKELQAAFKKLAGRFGSKFAKGGERLFLVLGFLIEALNDIHFFIADMQSIVDAIHTIRTDLENPLDQFFLPQGRPKTKVTVTYRKRIR